MKKSFKDFLKLVNSKLGRNTLKVKKLKEYREEAARTYEVYRNTRVGGYDVLESNRIFIAHTECAKEAKTICEEYRRDYILSLLDLTKKY